MENKEGAKAVIERVPISKLRPMDINQRRNFDGLDELAAEFEDNPVYPGEPWQPIIVARDGNTFRIVDGERRYRAMKEAKKVKECNAIVFDDLDDANATLVMLDTNHKEKLTDDEYSAGLQQALILGVPEKKVEARAGSKCAAAIRRQIKRNGGKVVQMSIGQMLAADEFADDKEAYDEIMQADPGSWEWKARRLRQKRDDEKKQAEAEAAALLAQESYGLQVVDKPPKGANLERSLYSHVAESIAKDAGEWAKDGFILVRPRETSYGYNTNWEVYSLPPDRTPEEEAAAKSKNALRRQAQLGRKRRLEWVARRMLDVGAMHGLKNVRYFVRDYVMKNQIYEVEAFCKKADIDSDFFNDRNAYRIGCEYVIARNWECMDFLTNADVDAIGDGTASDLAMIRHRAERHVKLVNAMRRDGYELSDEEDAFLKLAIKAVSQESEEESNDD